jgi:hypothetical protein
LHQAALLGSRLLEEQLLAELIKFKQPGAVKRS